MALELCVAPFRFARQVGGTMIEKVDPLSEVSLRACSPRLCICERSVVTRSGWWSSLKEPCTTRHAHADILPHDLFCSSCCAWFGTLVGVAVCCLVLVSLATRFCVHLSGHGVCEMDASAPLLLHFLSRFWVSKACSRHMMAYSILCFMCGYMSHVWRILNKGTLHQEGE